MKTFVLVSALITGSLAAAGSANAVPTERGRAVQIDHVASESSDLTERQRAADNHPKQTANAGKGGSTVCMFTQDVRLLDTPQSSNPACRTGAPS